MLTEGKCNGEFTKSGNFLIFVLFCLVGCVGNWKISNHGSEIGSRIKKPSDPA